MPGPEDRAAAPDPLKGYPSEERLRQLAEEGNPGTLGNIIEGFTVEIEDIGNPNIADEDVNRHPDHLARLKERKAFAESLMDLAWERSKADNP